MEARALTMPATRDASELWAVVLDDRCQPQEIVYQTPDKADAERFAQECRDESTGRSYHVLRVDDSWEEQQRRADHMTSLLASCSISIAFAPAMGDYDGNGELVPETQGHYFTGTVGHLPHYHFRVDDRGNGFLQQVVAELEQRARRFKEVADEVRRMMVESDDTQDDRTVDVFTESLLDLSAQETTTGGGWIVLLLGPGSAEVSYACQSIAEASSWVAEWELDNCGLTPVLLPSRGKTVIEQHIDQPLDVTTEPRGTLA